MTDSNRTARKRVPRIVMLLIIAAIVIVIDQIVKHWVVGNLQLHVPTDIFPWLKPIASFTYIRNTGVAFGMLADLGHIFRYLSPLVVIVVIFFQRTIPYEYFWVHFALGLVSGGALGNAIDRFTRGFVVDFIDLNIWPFQNFALFNVADSAITIGTAILLIDTIFAPVEHPETDDSDDSPIEKRESPELIETEANDATADV